MHACRKYRLCGSSVNTSQAGYMVYVFILKYVYTENVFFFFYTELVKTKYASKEQNSINNVST